MKFESYRPNSSQSPTPKTNIPSKRAKLSGAGQSMRVNRTGKSRLEVPQIFVLMAMLLMVIYAMHEAGKPENWEWMGFKQLTGTNSAPDQQPNQPLDSTQRSDSNFAPTQSGPVQFSDRDKDNPQDDIINTAEDFATSLSSVRSAVQATALIQSNTTQPSKIASEFWRSIIGKMKPQQQSMLLKMLRSMRHAAPLKPELREPCRSLVSIISKNRDRFNQELFDQLALTTEGTEEKKKFSTELFESQALWDEKILPAFKAAIAGEDFTLEQLQAIHQLQSTIDPVLFDQVQDKTAIGWAGDSGTWNRIWEIVLGSPSGISPTEPAPTFKPVTRIELMSQPKFYRGKPIKVEGWVRSARIKQLSKDSELGIKQQYIMWVRPKESKLGPYCVYASQLPANFPELSDRFQDVNEQVQIEGRFFKVRTYVAADSSATTSPVIIASTLTRVAPVEYTSVHSWQPSGWTLVLVLLLMPILATSIAWWAFRSSQTKPYQPGGKTAKKIDKTLEALTTDPSVQTDQEKIQALYDSDLDDFNSGTLQQ